MKNTNPIKSTKYLFLILICAFSTLWIGNIGSAKTRSIQVSTKNEQVNYSVETMRVTYRAKESECVVSPLKIDGVWMIPGKEVIQDLLGCYYSYNDATGMIKILTPNKSIQLQATLYSDTLKNNQKKITMKQPVLKGTSLEHQQTDILLPMDAVLKALGYTYKVNNTTIAISNSSYVYVNTVSDSTFDTDKYENALTGLVVTFQNNKDLVMGVTAKSIASANISISSDGKNNTVTLKYKHTKNLLGDVSKSLSDDIIESIQVYETDTLTTCIKITYCKKYIYTKKTATYGGIITISKGNFSIKIPLPDTVSFSKVTTSDQYWKNQFLILIPGNQKNFYKKYAPYNNSSQVKKITVQKTSTGNTRLIVKTSGLKGYRLTKGNGYFTVKVGSPRSIYKNIVLLDAGHGGKDSGATSKGVKEKNLNLAIIYTQAKQYFESNSSQVKAYWTRHDDTFVNLYARPKYSAKYQADLFVSLHMNSGNAAAKGTEVYYSKHNNKRNSSGLNSKLFAKRMENALVKNLKTKRRGVKQAGFVVNKYNTVPSILIELGFVTNGSDRSRLKKKSYQKKAAKEIYQGIVNTFKAYPTKR